MENGGKLYIITICKIFHLIVYELTPYQADMQVKDNLYGLSLKYTYAPTGNNKETELALQGEYLLGDETIIKHFICCNNEPSLIARLYFCVIVRSAVLIFVMKLKLQYEGLGGRR